MNALLLTPAVILLIVLLIAIFAVLVALARRSPVAAVLTFFGALLLLGGAGVALYIAANFHDVPLPEPGLAESPERPSLYDGPPGGYRSDGTSESPPAEAMPADEREELRLDDPDSESAPEVEAQPASTQLVGVSYSKTRPEWVESEPMRVGEIHTTAVSSGPYVRFNHAMRGLDEEMVTATNEYINDWLDDDRAAMWLNYDLDYIKTNLTPDKKNYHEETMTTPSVGPMQQCHALLEYNASFREEIEGRWRQIRATGRLIQMAFVVTIILAFVATLFAYFRLDTASRGFYSRRLQFAALVAILGVIAAGVLLAKFIPWV